MKVTKKGQSLSDAPQLLTILAVTGVIGAILLFVITSISASFTGVAAEAIGNITTAISNFFSLTPVLGTVFIAVILLAAVAVLGVVAYRRMQ